MNNEKENLEKKTNTYRKDRFLEMFKKNKRNYFINLENKYINSKLSKCSYTYIEDEDESKEISNEDTNQEISFQTNNQIIQVNINENQINNENRHQEQLNNMRRTQSFRNFNIFLDK